jgi:superfamily II DNA or RNA helicase
MTDEKRTRLTPQDRLRMVQLQLLDWLDSRGQPEAVASQHGATPDSLPPRWELTRGHTLRDWQREARDRWFTADGRGTVKVVTGAGKTLVALAIAEQLQHQHPELVVAIVVPTIVLMNQWYDDLHRYSNLPTSAIGRLGGGHEDTDLEGARIVIAVLASARRYLPEIVRRRGVGGHLLLVADECHRVGAPQMRKVLDTARAWSLGLSATPERDDDTEEDAPAFDATELGRAIGPIVYEMTFAQAIAMGVLPPIEIRHFGVPLLPDERERYEKLSRDIVDTRKDLHLRSPAARKAGSGETLVRWCRGAAARGGDGVGALAARYVALTAGRKDLVFAAASRRDAVRQLLLEELRERPDTRAILFHERIAEAEALFELLCDAGLPAVLEHGELPDQMRSDSLRLFRDGSAQIMVSVKALIEGLNVPEADLGVIVASSTSVRQRVQSIGRVLRKHRSADGEEKTARVCVLYVRDTVDDRLYEKVDWDDLIGEGGNRFYFWDPPDPPLQQDGPPKERVPSESEIDVTKLTIGAAYPGRYDGEEYSTDHLGNVSDGSGKVALNPQGVPEAVAAAIGRPGRFKVTKRTRAIVVLRREGAGWQPVFLGRLAEPLRFEEAEAAPIPDVSSLDVGADYLGPLAPSAELLYRRKGGGRIARRVRRGEVFASGPSATLLSHLLGRLDRDTGHPPSRVYLNAASHVFWREGGKARFLAALAEPLSWPPGGDA